MNKRQETSFNFGAKRSLTEGVCDGTNSDSYISRLQSDLQDVQEERTTGTHKKKSAFNRKYMNKQKTTPWPLARKRTIPTERPPLVDGM
jgi:hypothetical protein